MISRKKSRSLTKKIYEVANAKSGPFKMRHLYSELEGEKKHSIRARVYEKLGILFKKIARDTYVTITEKGNACMVIEGDGLDLSNIKDSSIDTVYFDPPWNDNKSNKGGNRNFATYETVDLNISFWKEVSRVVKDNHFVIVNMPFENANNYKMIYKWKIQAEECGLQYYAKVPWVKGNFTANTGRNSKNKEELVFFTKGKARKLRIDAKKSKLTGKEHFMRGAAGMLPTCFNIQPPTRKNRIHPSEKPVSLHAEVLKYVMKKGEVVLDMFAGSGNLGITCLEEGYNCILIEKAKKYVDLMKENLHLESFATV
ncbi:DNA-methyltransferase [Senegalia massiliensis]|nr:site-specific DNA-methyltransferase [Senegalia massiliensis]